MIKDFQRKNLALFRPEDDHSGQVISQIFLIRLERRAWYLILFNLESYKRNKSPDKLGVKPKMKNHVNFVMFPQETQAIGNSLLFEIHYSLYNQYKSGQILWMLYPNFSWNPKILEILSSFYRFHLVKSLIEQKEIHVDWKPNSVLFSPEN